MPIPDAKQAGSSLLERAAASSPWIVWIFHAAVCCILVCGGSSSVAAVLRPLLDQVMLLELLIIAVAGFGWRWLARLVGGPCSRAAVTAPVIVVGCLALAIFDAWRTNVDAPSGEAFSLILLLAVLQSSLAIACWGPSKSPMNRQAAPEMPKHKIPRSNGKPRQPVLHLPPNQDVYVGTIIYYIPEKEIGFLKAECGDFREDIYFKVSALSKELQMMGKGMEGKRVDFCISYRSDWRAQVRAAMLHIGY